MSSLIFTGNSIKADAGLATQWNQLGTLRKQHDFIQANAYRNMGVQVAANQAALIPQDAYRELDSITKRVFENDEGRGYFTSLMGLSKSIDIGKTAYLYRRASDKANLTTVSVSGQVPEAMNKTEYTYHGDPVPIFTTSYGREWREQKAFSTEGFDALFDDQYNNMRSLKEDMAIYMLWGNAGINIRGYEGQGILNHDATVKLDLGSGGANINLTTATADQIITYFTGAFANALDNNYVARVDELWVSPQIMRNLQKPYSGAGDFKEGTIKDYIERYGRVGKIEVTFELGRSGANSTGDYNAAGQGNEFFCYVKNQQALRPLVGQAISTVAIPRLMPMDNINFLNWSAMGMQVLADSNGRSQVFYASEVT